MLELWGMDLRPGLDALLVDVRPEILLRVALTVIAGTILGVEREHHGRAAGLRTTLLVSLAACVAMIISDSFYLKSVADTGGAPTWHPDPARLAAGALAGMGFLGAGVIIHQNTHLVRGVTTAATLWFATVVGLSFGAGALGIGIVATLLSTVVLVVLPALEGKIKNDWYSDLTVHVKRDGATLDEVRTVVEAFAIKIKGVDLEEDLVAGERRLTLHLKYKKGRMVSSPGDLTEQLAGLSGIRLVRWQA